MHGEQQHVILFCKLKQARAKHWTRRQIKRLLSFFYEPGLRCFVHGIRVLAHVRDRNLDVQRRHDRLLRSPVVADKSGSQNFVAADNLIQTAFEGGNVEWTSQTNRGGRVVDGAAGL